MNGARVTIRGAGHGLPGDQFLLGDLGAEIAIS